MVFIRGCNGAIRTCTVPVQLKRLSPIAPVCCRSFMVHRWVVDDQGWFCTSFSFIWFFCFCISGTGDDPYHFQNGDVYVVYNRWATFLRTSGRDCGSCRRRVGARRGRADFHGRSTRQLHQRLQGGQKGSFLSMPGLVLPAADGVPDRLTSSVFPLLQQQRRMRQARHQVEIGLDPIARHGIIFAASLGARSGRRQKHGVHVGGRYIFWYMKLKEGRRREGVQLETISRRSHSVLVMHTSAPADVVQFLQTPGSNHPPLDIHRHSSSA